MKRYTVAGSRPVLGHAPGETFEAEIPEGQERRLLRSRVLVLEDEVSDQTPGGLSDLNREELNALALEVGIENPGEFGSDAELVEAIEAADK